MLQGDMDKVKVVGVNNKYFVLCQYSRHIRPGFTIINSDDGNTVAAVNSATRTLVLVTVNYNSDQTVRYDLSRVGAVTPRGRWTTSLQSQPGGDQYNPVGCHPPACVVARDGKGVELTMPKDTISTIELTY